MGLLIINL